MSSPSAVNHPELFESRSVVDERHNQILERAVQNILSTDIAELAYAQIIDGLPLRSAYHKAFPRIEDHPVNVLAHKELCPGSLERAREVRKEFALSHLWFQKPPLEAFQRADDDSDEFKFRLIELVAVACHELGAYLYDLDSGIHPHSIYDEWKRKVCAERDAGVESRRYAYFPEIAFAHRAFQSSGNYPRGFADIAGYWVEGQLFGGVIIFDRGESGTECRSMWIHCDLRAGPSTLFPPTKVQLDALVSFLLAADLESYQTKCPLPIRGTKENRPRWDPDKAFAHYNIFRDRYEKTIAPEPQHPRDVFEARDWPELGDRVTLNMSVHQHREGFPQVTEEDLEQAEANMWNITPTSPLWPQYVSMRGRYGNGDVGEVLRIRLHCN